MMKKILLVWTAVLAVTVTHANAQISKAARDGGVIESGGLDESATTQFYAQNTGGGFDEYSLTEFAITKADFGGADLLDISAVTLTLTVDDRFFSASGPFSILFTPDSKTDLLDYAGLLFNSASPYGIDSSDFVTAPIVVGSGVYDGTASGIEVILNLAAFESELIAAINASEPFHLLIGNLSTDPTAATFSGIGNSFNPGNPTLNITATTDGISPEPADYPTDFSASATFNSISLSWIDATDTTGYVVQISDTNSFPGVTDGIAPVDDTDLSDGSGQLIISQGTQAATFSGLEETQEYFFTIFPYSNLGTDADYKTDGTTPEASAITAPISVGDILFTQYYEGSANNKYLELTNVSESTIDLNGFVIANFDNARAEDWKLGIASATRTTELTGLSIGSGQTIIVADPGASSPITVADASISSGQSTFFNGNDSLVLFSDSSQSLASLVDAIPFTEEGFEGGEISFVRATDEPGFNLTAGTSVLDFPSVWTSVDISTVDSATFGEDAYLGSSGLVTPPPQIFFNPSLFIVSEGGGSIDLILEIQNPDGNEVDVDVVFLAGSSAAEGGDIGSYTTQLVTFHASATSGDTQTVTITLTDDSDEESTESAVFELQNLATIGDALIGASNQVTVQIQDNDTSIPNLFISEVADPSDDPTGRFVEIYNPTGSPVDLSAGNWNLELFFNANATPGETFTLTGIIPAGGTHIVGQTGFEAVYGFAPGDIGYVNFNGDDNLELRFGGDASIGVLVDVYGQPGTDGTGLSWDFEDSRAIRLDTVTSGSTTFDPAEWFITPTDVATAAPGEYPDSLVLPPTGVTATAQSDTSISVGFTPVSGNDVIVVFNTSDSFTSPLGPVPEVGDSFNGGTVLSVGTTTPILHSGLTASTEYFYAFISTDGTDYSPAVVTSATTDNVSGFIGSEDFGSDPASWVNQTATGGDDLFGWQIIDGEAIADGFDGPAGQVHYLVSPALDFSGASNPVIEFDYGEAYAGPPLELQYSTDYSGSGVPTEGVDNWTGTGFVFEEDLINADADFSSFSTQVELPASLEGESTVYLAFRYTADGTETGSRQWFIDNIVVRSLPAETDPLGDYLSSYGLTLADLSSDSGDNDGLPVIIEYLVDGDPAAPTSIELGAIVIEEVEGEPKLVLRFTSTRADEPEGVTIELHGSNDLGLTDSFALISFEYLEPVDNLDGTYTHRYRQIAVIGSPTAKSFIRLQVTPVGSAP